MTLQHSISAITIAAVCSSCSLDHPPQEREITLVTKPTFKTDSLDEVGGGDVRINTLKTSAGGTERSIYWPEDAPQPHTLSKTRKYTIDLVEEEHRFGHESVWTPELVRVKDGERVIFDASVCRVHKRQMTREKVRIFYGFPSFDRDYIQQAKAFPNTGLSLGGCCVSEIDPQTSREWICPECLAAQKQWKDIHPEKARSVPADPRIGVKLF